MPTHESMTEAREKGNRDVACGAADRDMRDRMTAPSACNRVDGTALLVHRVGEEQRPSNHPLCSPEGDGVYTQDRPAHHPWQHGLYARFNLVNGIGFWKEQPGDGLFHPTLTFAPEVAGSTARWAVENLWKGPDSATLITEGRNRR